MFFYKDLDEIEVKETHESELEQIEIYFLFVLLHVLFEECGLYFEVSFRHDIIWAMHHVSHHTTWKSWNACKHN